MTKEDKPTKTKSSELSTEDLDKVAGGGHDETSMEIEVKSMAGVDAMEPEDPIPAPAEAAATPELEQSSVDPATEIEPPTEIEALMSAGDDAKMGDQSSKSAWETFEKRIEQFD
jgi:hypothetical protein